jgi:drug/metabolite transporter (DMT)-like permease
MKQQRAGDLFAFICAVIVGLGNILAKLALEDIDVELFNLLFFGSAFVLTSLALVRKSNRGEISSTSSKTILIIAGISVIFTFALYTYFLALKMIQPATVAFLSRIEVIFVVIMAYFILKERLRPIEIIGGLIAVSGIFVLKYRTNIAISEAATIMIISAFLFGLAEILVKKNIKIIGVYRFVLIRNFVSLVVFFIMFEISGQRIQIPDLNTIILIVASALLLPILGRTLYIEALKRIKISRAALITQSAPLFTALFAFLILYTTPTPIEWLGGLLIMIGVVIIKLFERRNNNHGKSPIQINQSKK